MKNIYKSILVIFIAFTATACFNKKEAPNYQYFPDMYESPSYETYGEYEIFQDGQSALEPAENTIPRGSEVYEYPNTFEGKNQASANLKNPLPYTERNVNKGGQLYDIHCAICHGFEGDGKGPLVEREKFLGIPGFDDPNRDMSEGNIYHVMYYGLNNMGSYAAQTTTKERWQIDHYVHALKDKLEGKDAREFVKDTLSNRENFDREINPNHETQMVLKNQN